MQTGGGVSVRTGGDVSVRTTGDFGDSGEPVRPTKPPIAPILMKCGLHRYGHRLHAHIDLRQQSALGSGNQVEAAVVGVGVPKLEMEDEEGARGAASPPSAARRERAMLHSRGSGGKPGNPGNPLQPIHTRVGSRSR